MKQEDLMKAMNGADDALIEEAHASVRKRRVLPKVLIAAAVAAALTVTAAAAGLFGVRLFTNGQEARQAMDEQADEYGYGTMWQRDSAPVFTREEAVKAANEVAERAIEIRLCKDGLRDDESGGATWNRHMTFDGGYYYSADDLTTLVKNDAAFCADFSYLDEVATPVEGAVYLYRETIPLTENPAEDEWHRQAFCTANYLTADGGVLELDISVHSGKGVGLDSVYAESFVFDEEIKSADGISFRFFGTGDGRVDAIAAEGTVRIQLNTWVSDPEVLRDIVEHTYFADMLDALNAEYLTVD